MATVPMTHPGERLTEHPPILYILLLTTTPKVTLDATVHSSYH